MKEKKVTETELFRKLNILLTDKNKEHLDEVTDSVSLMANEAIDNSGFIRGAIEYYHDHPKELTKILPYIKKERGYNLLQKLLDAFKNDMPNEEILETIGIGEDIVEKTREKYHNS